MSENLTETRQHCMYCCRQPHSVNDVTCAGSDIVLTKAGIDFCGRLLTWFNAARATKNYALSDRLRKLMTCIGILQGTSLWHPFFCQSAVFRELFTQKKQRTHKYITYRNCGD